MVIFMIISDCGVLDNDGDSEPESPPSDYWPFGALVIQTYKGDHFINGTLQIRNITRKYFGAIVNSSVVILSWPSLDGFFQFHSIDFEMNFENNRYGYTSFESTLEVYLGITKDNLALFSKDNHRFSSRLEKFHVAKAIVRIN